MTEEKYDSMQFPTPEDLGIEEGPGDAAETKLPRGTELGNYIIEAYLDEGGMGVVYRAAHKFLQSVHALKVIRSKFAGQSTFVSRFRREARIMAALEHPHIVRVTDFGEVEGFIFYIMDFVSGPQGEVRTLQDYFDEASRRGKKRALPEPSIKAIALQICSALSYAHAFREEGVAHLDLKPSNILLVGSEKGRRRQGMTVKVTDFGFAKILGGGSALDDDSAAHDGSEKKLIIGTPRYMSPEQWEGIQAAGPASDIYSFGIILYEALTGRIPSEVDPPKPPSAFGCSPEWDPIIERCLQANPRKRYRRASRLMGDLRRIRFDRRTRRTKVFFRGFLALALATAAAAYVIEYDLVHDPAVRQLLSGTKDKLRQTSRKLGAGFDRVGSISIKSDPDVVISAVGEDGRQYKLGRTDVRGRALSIVLPVGRYDLVLSRAGYLPAIEKIVVLEDEVLMIERRLEEGDESGQTALSSGRAKQFTSRDAREPGPLRVLCDVPGARVFLDDAAVAMAGEVFYLPMYRMHELEVRAPGYQPKRLPVTLYGTGRGSEDFKVVLKPIPVRVRFAANVDDAAVYRDNRYMGKVGEEVEVVAGRRYVFELRSKGYRPARVRLDLADAQGGGLVERSVELEPVGPSVMVDATIPASADSGAEVTLYVNGAREGVYRLPFRWQAPDEGAYRLALGGNPWKRTAEQTVKLTDDASLKAFFKLDYLDSCIVFEPEPADAVVYMNGVKQQSRRVVVEPGRKHEVRIWAKGHKAETRFVSVVRGETNRVAVKLQPVDSSRSFW